jgi:hypothetical protein
MSPQPCIIYPPRRPSVGSGTASKVHPDSLARPSQSTECRTGPSELAQSAEEEHLNEVESALERMEQLIGEC